MMKYNLMMTRHTYIYIYIYSLHACVVKMYDYSYKENKITQPPDVNSKFKVVYIAKTFLCSSSVQTWHMLALACSVEPVVKNGY